MDDHNLMGSFGLPQDHVMMGSTSKLNFFKLPPSQIHNSTFLLTRGVSPVYIIVLKIIIYIYQNVLDIMHN